MTSCNVYIWHASNLAIGKYTKQIRGHQNLITGVLRQLSVVITIAVRRFVELIKDDFRLHLETYVISRFCCNFSIIPLACQTFSNSDLGVRFARACENKKKFKIGQVVKTATKQVIP